MKKSILNNIALALASALGVDGKAAWIPHLKTNPGASWPARSMSIRPPKGWRKALSLRRHKKLMAKRKANARR